MKQMQRYATAHHSGPQGLFYYVLPATGALCKIISSDGSDWEEAGMKPPAWEHVSISMQHRCPTWEEMDHIKRLFWEDGETVVQYHVPRKSHVNIEDTCLHLWRPIGVEIPRPPQLCV